MGTAAVEGDLWGARARDWAEIAEPTVRSGWEALLANIEIAPGLELLDVGCGAGGALAAARQMGARVTGIDASANLAEIARERNPGARIEVGEMEELPFPDESFDIVTGFNAFQFAEDMVNALKEARRVCRVRGSVGILFWDQPAYCETATSVFPAVFSLLPPAPPSGPSVSEPGEAESRLAAAGLTPVKSGCVDCAFEFADMETAVCGMSSAGLMIRVSRIVGDDTLAAAIRGSLAPFTRPDGTVRQTNRFRWIISRRE